MEAKVRKALDESGYINFLDILERNKHFHTSSMFVRTDVIRKLPRWYYQSPVGDYPTKVISAYMGNVYYIDEIMSVYRKGNSGSYTNRKHISQIQEDGWLSNLEKDHLLIYKNLDQFTQFKYSHEIQGCLQTRYVSVLDRTGNLDFLDISSLEKKH